MADQTKRGMVALGPSVRDELNEYRAALQAQQGRGATQGELVGAFLRGVPLWQADLMVRAYMTHTRPEEGETGEGSEADA
jgi:hypothetical protein